MDSKGQYLPVDDNESVEENEFSSSGFTLQLDRPTRSARSSFHQHLLLLGKAEAILLVFALSLALYSSLRNQQLNDHDLLVATNTYSPLIERGTLHFKTMWTKTALINKHNVNGPSPYQTAPSAEVDEAWRALYESDGLSLIEEHEVRKMGKDPDYVVKAPDEWGMGENQYLAVSQAQHNIYCLDKLRKFAYSDHYYGNRTEELEVYALHCLDTLLQTLRCKFSTDLYTAMWVEGSQIPFVEFNTFRKCQVSEGASSRNPRKHFTKEQFKALRAPPGAAKRPEDSL